MLGTLLTGIVSCLSMFHTTSSSTVQWGGSGKGFTRYYSTTGITKRSIPLSKFDNYAQTVIKDILSSASPSLKAQYQDLADNVQEIVDYGEMEVAL